VWKQFQPPLSAGSFRAQACHHGLPVHRLHIDLEAALLEQGLGEGAMLVSTGRVVDCIRTTGVPS